MLPAPNCTYVPYAHLHRRFPFDEPPRYRRTASFSLYRNRRIRGHLQCRRDKRQRKRVCTRIIQSSRGARKGRRSLKNTRQNVFPSGNHRCPTRQVRAPSCRAPPPDPPLVYAGPEFKVTPLHGTNRRDQSERGPREGFEARGTTGQRGNASWAKERERVQGARRGGRKGVGRSRGQGETMSHRPESRVRARYTLLQDASTSLHLHAVAQWGCGREEGGGGRGVVGWPHSPQHTVYPDGTRPPCH